MITPAFNLTATERVLPRLALDFTTSVLDPRVTVTRALNTATRINSSGLVEGVNANLPRFDYDPVTFLPKGLLIEESRTNSALDSSNMDFYWPTRSAVTLNNNTVIAPDGTQTAATLVENSAPAQHFVAKSVAGLGTNTWSIYVKPNGRSWVSIQLFGGNQAWFNISTGTIGLTQAGVTPTITSFGNGWYRCSVSSAFVGVSTNLFIRDSDGGTTYQGDGVSGIHIWGTQLEIGATFPTSYIPTDAVPVVRNADVVSMTGTNFSDWYVSSSAALAAVVIPNIATGTRPIWQLDDTTANEIIALRGNVADPELYIVDNGVSQAQLDAGTITAGTQYGLCAAFAANSCAVSQNGATPVTTATATMPTVTQARIGSDGSNFLNGAVRTLRYWPQRILNAETQAFSK